MWETQALSLAKKDPALRGQSGAQMLDGKVGAAADAAAVAQLLQWRSCCSGAAAAVVQAFAVQLRSAASMG
jgi:hypothetical protein